MNYLDRAKQLLKDTDDRRSQLRVNPVTGGHFVRDLDPLAAQVRIAAKALEARDWFEFQRPPGAPELPLTAGERDRLKRMQGIGYIVSVFAGSLRARDYEVDGHPNFGQYASGVLASALTPDFIGNDPDLLRRYPPTPLAGLGSGLVWQEVTKQTSRKRR